MTFAAVAAVIGAQTLSGCGQVTPADRRETGSISLALNAGTGSVSSFDEVTYTIDSSAGAHLARGTIGVRNATAPTALVTGLPVGSDNVVTLDATSTDGRTGCHGFGLVDIAPRQTVVARVVLQCRAERPGLGAVAINARFDNCPVIDSFSPTAPQVPFGGSIAVNVLATDADPGDRIQYAWTADSALGQLAHAEASVAIFTCQREGTTSLSILVSDGVCTDSLAAAIAVTCLPAPICSDEAPSVGGAVCGRCTVHNCSLAPTPVGTEGCCGLPTMAEQLRCEEAARCFEDNADRCVVNGDATACFCGSTPGACPGNGVCADVVRAAAGNTDPATVVNRFTNPAYPIGRAANLISCRATYCRAECGLANGPTVIGGGLDNCPFLDSISASALEAPVGGAISVGAVGVDLDPGAVVFYSWAATPAGVGAFDDAHAASTTFRCQRSGTAALSISVSDGVCGDDNPNAMLVDCFGR